MVLLFLRTFSAINYLKVGSIFPAYFFESENNDGIYVLDALSLLFEQHPISRTPSVLNLFTSSLDALSPSFDHGLRSKSFDQKARTKIRVSSPSLPFDPSLSLDALSPLFGQKPRTQVQKPRTKVRNMRVDLFLSVDALSPSFDKTLRKKGPKMRVASPSIDPLSS